MVNKQRKYIMYPHGGSGNHGCEAIVRTTVRLIGEENDLILFSDNTEEDKKYIEKIKFDIKSPKYNIKKNSLKYILSALKYHLFNVRDSFDVLSFSPIITAIDNNSVLLSIGGDNYCYGDNEYIYLINKYARKKGCKTVLWGCSIGEDDLTDKMVVDLSKYDLIIARESISYFNLKKINSNTVLIPDPAFTLKTSKAKVSQDLLSKPYIGINISPMIQSKEKIKGITVENYIYLIDKIILETEYNVALIPHVVKDKNDDRIIIKEVYDKIVDKNRVYIVEDQNCEQLKSIISGCECFIGARTHSTIAAYSSCVPTLVVGYSVKAKGIAKDLFGSYQKYVIPVQELKIPEDIYIKFNWILEHKMEIRCHLKNIMPEYINRVYNMKNYLKKIV